MADVHSKEVRSFNMSGPHPPVLLQWEKEATFVILMADVHTKEQRGYNMS
jgi:hypothetical protein